MDDPLFYRDDLQAYYDLQVSSGKDEVEAIRAVKKKFKVKSVTVTPTGEVRSPGVVDNPDPPDAPAPPPEGDEPAPEEEPEGPGSQMGDEDPHGKDAPKQPKSAARNEDGPQLPGRCEIPTGAWVEFLRADGDLDEFEAWALETYPELTAADLASWRAPDLSEHWRPSHLPKRNARVDEIRKLSPARRDLYERFTRLVNMRTGEMRTHLRSTALREMVVASRRSKRGQLVEGRRLARHVLRMKATPVQEWDDTLWSQCRKVVSLIERARRNSAPLVDENGSATRKLFALRSLGHNPTVPARVHESEIEALCEDPRALHRYVDSTPGRGLTAIVDEVVRVPDFDVLKKGKVDLEPEERERVMKDGAVWHNLPGSDKPTPAVWKSQVGERTWYVTNTHRAYNVRPTLAGAIGRYHRFIKGTA